MDLTRSTRWSGKYGRALRLNRGYSLDAPSLSPRPWKTVRSSRTCKKPLGTGFRAGPSSTTAAGTIRKTASFFARYKVDGYQPKNIFLDAGHKSMHSARLQPSIFPVLKMEPSNRASKSLDRAERLAQNATELFQEGRYRQAESVTRRVLAIREKVLGSGASNE
jgi:hypothetical protein